MSNINPQPIIDLIQKEARDSARKVISEAQDRASTILEHSSARVEQALEQTRLEAQKEADLLEDRMRRMAGLEERKDLVNKKRAFIDEAFKTALDKLNAQSSEQVASFMESLVIKYAAGGETLKAGAMNDGFFTSDFVERLNKRLVENKKTGALTMSDGRLPNVCGLVLQSDKSDINCTFAALLETRREELEAVVADILFAHENT